MGKGLFNKIRLGFLLIGILVLSVVFTQCHKNWFCESSDCVRGSGQVVRDTRQVGYFNRVALNGNFHIIVRQEGGQGVVVECEENLMSYISTVVINGDTLEIDSNRCVETHVGVRIYLSMNEIKGFFINGSGSITAETPIDTENLLLQINGSGNVNLDVNAKTVTNQINGSGDIRLLVTTDNMITQVNGSGKVRLEGRTRHHVVNINASGDLLAYDLEVNNYNINLIGSGTCQIHVLDSLKVVITGSGDVYYIGNPQHITSVIIGSGRLVKI